LLRSRISRLVDCVYAAPSSVLLHYGYFWVYSALIASFKLLLSIRRFLQQAGVAAAATMSPPEATQSKRTQEIQGRNRVAR
jgi:hypothetical protein